MTEQDPPLSTHHRWLKDPDELGVNVTLPEGAIAGPAPVSLIVATQVVPTLTGTLCGLQANVIEVFLGITCKVNDSAPEVLLGECWSSP
jgi:hypothetical protein